MNSYLDIDWDQLYNLIHEKVRFGLFYLKEEEDKLPKDILSKTIYHKSVKSLKCITKEINKKKWDLEFPLVLVSCDDWCQKMSIQLEKQGHFNVCYHIYKGRSL